MAGRLTDYKVLTFDCYGTLIDWESGIWDALQPLFTANGYRPDRAQVLAAFGECEHAEQSANPGQLYPDILRAVHRAIAGKLQLESSADLDAAFGASVPHWPAFADSANALRDLKKTFRLVILSNVHRDGIAASVRKLGVEFDAIYTAEDIGSYKPADANFEYLLKHLDSDLGLRKPDILHTAQSLLHDHAAANRFGLANCWIDRQRLSETGDHGVVAGLDSMPTLDHRFFTLGEMADAVAAEC